MKKSTLFLSLILSVSSAFPAFAQNEYKIDPTKEITVAPDALEGVVAIPTDADGTSVWTLKGGNDWDLGTLPLAQWGSKAQHNFVKFQKPTGDYSACGVEGNIYTLICINENGENFSQWGNPGAINMQPEGAVMFSLGFGSNFGQDGDYLGLWKIEYEEGKGYVLQNVGRIVSGRASYASPISANPIEEKTYVKLYSEFAINEAITDSKIEAAVAKLNAVPSVISVDLTAVNAAKETVMANRTQENLDALINAVDAALATVSRTNLIVNPEINGDGGWTTEREFGGNGPLLGTTSFEYWAGNASDRQAASFNYYQTIEVPNGKYLVSVEMYNSSNDEGGEEDHTPNGNAGLYATSGDVTSFVGVTTDAASFGTVYNTEVIPVKDGKLTLGVKSIGYLSARWFAADNFNLWYVGELDEPTPDPEPTTLFADGTYTVKNVSLEKNLTIVNNGVSVAEDAQVILTNVEGGYVISNADGEYIHKFTGDTWSFDVTTNAEEAYLISIEEVEGGYELKGASGTLGLDYGVKAPDNTDDVVYANKSIEFNGVWTITKVTDEPQPVEDLETVIAQLDKAINAASKKLNACVAGDALFMYPESELAPLSNAIAAANEAKAAEGATVESIKAAKTALSEAVEAFAPKANAPKEGQAYVLSLTTANNNQLSISAEGIKIEEAGSLVYFVAQENGYALSNGTEYVNYEGSNKWTMTASADAYAWTIAPVEGGYSITGKNGLFGTNAEETAAGSPCYGDKKTSNGNYIWAITEYVEPTPDPEPIDPALVEIPMATQQEASGVVTLATKTEGDGYTEYTFDGQVCVAIKMLNVNVEGCDYVVVKFAEPVPAGIKASFVNGEGNQDIPEGATEVKCVIADNPDVVNGVMPQITILTIFAEAGKRVKIIGAYKHLTEEALAVESVEAEATTSVKKMMVDGKVVIVKGGKTYNVAGSLLK